MARLLRTFKSILALLAFLAFALSGCGQKSPPSVAQVLSIDPDFQGYVIRFEESSTLYGAPTHVDNLIIKFGPTLTRSERGNCIIAPGATPTITVSPESWEGLSEGEREEFIFHELGHCVLRRKHLTSLDSASGTPASIMHPEGISSRTYLGRQDAYLRELFSLKNEF